MTLRRRLLQFFALLFVVTTLSQLWYLGQVLRLQYHNPDSSAYMHRALEQGQVQQYWRDYDQISDHLKKTVLISEDAQFTRHFGFDWAGIRYAIRRNLEAGKPVAGGSTITQQLAKNLYLSGNRSYTRKIQEALIALMLEIGLSKKRILELYLNVAQWGHQIYGAEAAARHYFQVSAADLSAEQAAQLAAILPRPNLYDFKGPTDYLSQRTDWILQQMQLVRIPDPRPLPAVPVMEPASADGPAASPSPTENTDATANEGSPAGIQQQGIPEA